MAALATLIVVVVSCVFGPMINHLDPTKYDLYNIDSPPSAIHWLGTDDGGYDVFIRLLYGGRISLLIGFSTMVITVGLGTLVGGVAGYYGGKIDMLLMRLVDLILNFPFLLFVITIVAVLNKVSIWITILSLGLLGWTGTARIVRGQVLAQRQQDYVMSATIAGCSNRQIIFRHIVPNVVGTIIVQATIAMASFILIEAGLSFLGFGVAPPTASWGNMLNAARSMVVLKTEWWLWVPPGLAIMLTVLSINFIGDGLRDALDPRTL